MDDPGPRRRRSYTKAFKRGVVAETREPGVSVALVARRHGMNANVIFNWLRDPRFADADLSPAFLPVEVSAAPTCAEAVQVDPAPSAVLSSIDISLPCGVQVTCRGAVDRQALGAVLLALGRHR